MHRACLKTTLHSPIITAHNICLESTLIVIMTIINLDICFINLVTSLYEDLKVDLKSSTHFNFTSTKNQCGPH
jgi:hypothetical protein